MSSLLNRHQMHRCLPRFLFCVAAVLFLAGGAILVDRHRDMAVLEAQALRIVANATQPSDRIAAINHWVYTNQGFDKNEAYYGAKYFGPTALQVMRDGGDCSDKSRLVSAMLAQIGIRSGLVMLAQCVNCTPIHTVVEAEHESGLVVVDPVWDVVYRGPTGKYLALADLKHTTLAWQHIDMLKYQGGPKAHIWGMWGSQANFDFVKTVNWDKNLVTRVAHVVLDTLDGVTSWDHRPALLEDPQLYLATLLFAGGFGIIVIGLLVVLGSRRMKRRGQSLTQSAAR